MRRGVKNIYLGLMVHRIDMRPYVKKKIPNLDRLDGIMFFSGAVAIGSNAVASSTNSIAIGYNAIATNAYYK